MPTTLELRQRLMAVQELSMRLLSGVTEEQFKRRPAATAEDPKPWSIAEVLAHNLTIEQTWTARIGQALREDGATIEPSAPEAHEEGARRGRAVPVPLLIHALLGARRETEKLLERAEAPGGGLLPNALWHPRLQERLDMAWMFEKIAGHHEEHCAQIEALRDSVGARPAAGRAGGTEPAS